MRRRLDETAAAMGGRPTVRGRRRPRVAGRGARLARGPPAASCSSPCPASGRDGHRFVARALAAGAAAAVVHEDVGLRGDAVPEGSVLLRVDDTYRALHALADRLRRQGMPPKLAAITGSVGKTTTKELLDRRPRPPLPHRQERGQPQQPLRLPAVGAAHPGRHRVDGGGDGDVERRRAVHPVAPRPSRRRRLHLRAAGAPRVLRQRARHRRRQGGAARRGGGGGAGGGQCGRPARRAASSASGRPGRARRRGWCGTAAATASTASTPAVTVESLRAAGPGETGSRFTLVVRRGCRWRCPPEVAAARSGATSTSPSTAATTSTTPSPRRPAPSPSGSASTTSAPPSRPPRRRPGAASSIRCPATAG